MNIKNCIGGVLAMMFLSSLSMGQELGWQQKVEYAMDIKMDVTNDTFSGTQKLVYYNNSPDTLNKVFYHLYFNAFQPGSMMDVRSRTIDDPDRRVKSRIYNLKPSEIGFQKVASLKQDGKKLTYEVQGTILEVMLDKPILPGKTSKFDMVFNGQVPAQIRRSGRDNAEGVRYSMAQWFPKIAEYDQSGWHAHPYIAREFYSPWGTYDVKITIDDTYVIGGTGILQNPNAIGHGYDSANSQGKEGKKGMLTWHFKAENVHDFVWAADPDYVHDVVQVENGPTVHYFYQGDTLVDNWKELPKYIGKAFNYINKNFGKYPFEQYAIIQGGDGGMEYPMATLITGHRPLYSLVGVSVHEMLHSWYQMVLATNESYYSWMDEGFTSYASAHTMNYLFNDTDPAILGSDRLGYNSYFSLVKSGLEEPLTTHSDHFSTNKAYGTAAYSKGSMTLHQLGYIIGIDKLRSGLLRYFNTWKFRHPDKGDFIRIMEKESGLELDWYFDYWVNTTGTVDYGIKSVIPVGGKTRLQLTREGKIPMPIEVEVTLNSGDKHLFYTPLGLMRGEKTFKTDVTVLSDWPWVNPLYSFEVPFKMEDIKSIEVDPSKRMADIDRKNNVFPFTPDLDFVGVPKK